ncbi:hypothetical protein DFR72_10953 [Lentzea flaviverrucosa]|uniref:Uncharacterized protein n=1 Tax=Lentzea flaviverrucosa TaxID=200379 RepID=A0A1H9C7U9_9PSEU|nr:hypothetical protein DFR72_10953 [Lentzea flaviverrucosa]SEP97276.1 hypothetical protein SAMN05216195_101708 [Lentzea flaviverrucosa]
MTVDEVIGSPHPFRTSPVRSGEVVGLTRVNQPQLRR